MWSLSQWGSYLAQRAQVVQMSTTELQLSHRGAVSIADGAFEFVAEELKHPVRRGGGRSGKISKFRRSKHFFCDISATDVNGLVLVQFHETIKTFALNKNLTSIGLRCGIHHELLVVAKLCPDLQKDHPILQYGNIEGLFGTALDYEENQRGLTLAYYYAPCFLRHELKSAFASILPMQRILAARI